MLCILCIHKYHYFKMWKSIKYPHIDLFFLVFNAQLVPENPLSDIIFPEYCANQVHLSDDELCDVSITIPANAIIYQRTVEGTYMHAVDMYVCMTCTFKQFCVARSKSKSVLYFPLKSVKNTLLSGNSDLWNFKGQKCALLQMLLQTWLHVHIWNIQSF